MWPPVPIGVGLEVEGSISAGLGVVADLIFVQIPPEQSKEHFSASHWTTHAPPIQDCLHSFTLNEQVILPFPPGHPCVQFNESQIISFPEVCSQYVAFLGQVMMSHPPPRQLWKHWPALHCKDLQMPPGHFCKQLFIDDLQSKASQYWPAHSCSQWSYGDVRPHRIEQGDGEQAL